MEENGYRFGVGVMVLASAMIGILLIVFFGAMPSFLLDRYRVTISFPSAPGVKPDTPVLKSGLVIGRVVRTQLLNDYQGGVNLQLELDRQHPIRRGETCRIASGSFITNDAIVEFVQPTEQELLKRFDGVGTGLRNGILEAEEREVAYSALADGDLETDGIVKSDPMESIVGMKNDFSRASQKIERLAESIQEVFGDDQGQVREVFDRAKKTLDTVDRTAASINRVAVQIEDSRLPEAIAESLEKLPSILDEARIMVVQTQRILGNFERLSAQLEALGTEFEGIGETAQSAVENANAALQNIDRITKPISVRAPELVDGAILSLTNLDKLLIDLSRFSNRLNAGDGTIARLIDDQQLYYEVVQTLQNVRMVTQQLQPIASDVRVFTDKIARDPGQLGVRGALQGRPNGAGLK